MALGILLLLLAQATAADAEMQAEKKSNEALLSLYSAQSFAEDASKLSPLQATAGSDAAKSVWSNCVSKFAENASIVESDSTIDVVNIALNSCRIERSNAEIAWAKMIFRSSRFHPDMQTAMRWSKQSFDEFETAEKQSLPVIISLFRQMRILKK